MRRIIAALSGGMLVMAALAGCREPMVGVQKSDVFDDDAPAHAPIPQGTAIQVRLTSAIGTSHSAAGDAWEGVLSRPVIANGRVLFHDGSVVRGQVRRTDRPSQSQPAALDLAVTAIEEDGLTRTLSAGEALGSRWTHIELKPGTVMTFTVEQTVAAR